MAETTEKIISIRTQVEGANTIKELKGVISDLNKEMLNADSSSKEYQDAVDGLVEAEYKLSTAMKKGKSQLESMPGSYNDLVNQMAALKKVMHSVNDDATIQELSTQINDINGQLKAMDAANGVYSRNVGNYLGSLQGLGLEFKNQRDELRQLKQVMEQLPPTSQAYSEAFARAAEITHNLADQTESLKYASPDLGDQLSNVNGIASNLAAGYSAVNAAMGLFGEQNEDLQKVLVKVQQTMALVQGLQGMDGLIKRTQGLSQGLGLVKKQTLDSAKASTADATAKAGETVATEGATVAQKGLNAAMKANPIGAVIVIVTALIGVFVLLKDDIIELVGGQEKLNSVSEKVKVVLAGVGNVIKNVVLGPIKLLITNVKTLINTFKSLASGDIKGAWQAIKDGFNSAIDTVKDTYDVIGNYQEASAEKSKEIEEKRLRDAAEARAKDKDNYIKDQEAKLGSDWKYSKEGKKAYDEYYKEKLEMYKKDSDDYLKVQREMWGYQREFDERRTKSSKKSSEDKKKAELESIKAIEKAYDDYVTKFMTTDSGRAFQELQKSIDAWNAKYPDNPINIGLVYDPSFTKEEFEKALDEGFSNIDLDRILKHYNYGNILAKTLFDFKTKDFDYKKLVEGIVEPEETRKLIEEAFTPRLNYLEKEYAKLEELSKGYAEDFGTNSEIYKKVMGEMQTVLAERTDLLMDQTQRVSNAWKAFYDKNIADIKNHSDEFVNTLNNGVMEYESQYNAFWTITENSITILQNRQRIEDALYEDRKFQYEELIKTYRAMSVDKNLTDEERKNASIELARAEMELENIKTDHIVEQNKIRMESTQEYYNMVKDTLGGIGDILGNVSNAWEQSIENQVAAGKMSEKEADRQFESLKGIKYAETMVNAFSSAAGAYQSLASIPYVGPALGAAAAAAALASGIAQAVSIKNMTRNGGGSSSSSNRYAEVIPQTPTDFEPTWTQNVTGEQETQDLANAITKSPIKAYVVESEMSDAQKKANTRNNESTF